MSYECVYKCVSGCNIFHGGEIRHHKDCVFYPESLTQLYDLKDKELEKLKQQNEKLKKALEFYADFNSWQLGECVIDSCDQENYQGGKLARQVLKEIEESEK